MADPAKTRLLALIAERQTTLKAVSLAIGQSHSYLQQWIRYDTPRALSVETREALGTHFNVDPDEFRSTPTPAIAWSRNGTRLAPGRLRLAMSVAERVVGNRAVRNRDEAVLEIASAIYDVLMERGAEGRPIDDDADALRAIEAILRRIQPPDGP
jgi:hypothetical protein